MSKPDSGARSTAKGDEHRKSGSLTAVQDAAGFGMTTEARFVSGVEPGSRYGSLKISNMLKVRAAATKYTKYSR